MKLIVKFQQLALLFILLFQSFAINLSCLKLLQKNSSTTSEEWINHPLIISSLSKAIVDGIHHLHNELLISEAGFKDMDISIMAEKSEILKSTITYFTLHHNLTQFIFTQWRIFRFSQKGLDYVNTISFNNIEDQNHSGIKDGNFSVLPDTLFIDIYESSSKFSFKNYSDLSDLEVIFWRDVSQNDKLASVRLIKNLNNEYTVLCPGFSAK